MAVYNGLLSVLFITFLVLQECESATKICSQPEQSIIYKVMGSKVTITSPGYPNPMYSTTQPCIVNIRIEPRQMVGFRIEQQNVGSEKCSVDYRLLDSDDSQLTTIPTCKPELGSTPFLEGLFQLSDSDIRLKLPAGSGLGFTLNFTAHPLYIMNPVSKHTTTSARSGYIVSHEGFNFRSSFYDESEYNTLTLTDVGGATEIILNFIQFNIGRRDSCQSTGDIFTVYEKTSAYINELYSCGDAVFSSQEQVLKLSPQTTSLVFKFKAATTETFRGFFLDYSVIGTSPPTTAAPTTTAPITIGPTSTVPTTTVPTTTVPTTTVPTTTAPTTVALTTAPATPQNPITENNSQISSTSQTPTFPTKAGKNASTTPTVKPDFFAKPANYIAVAAGGGGLILIIIIMALACVVCRKSQTRRKDSTKQQQSAGGTIDGFVQIGLKPVSSEPSPTETTKYSKHLDADQIASNEYSMVDLVTGINTDTSNVEASLSHIQISPSAVRREPEGEERNKIDVTYAVVDKKTTIMIENDLYGSRD